MRINLLAQQKKEPLLIELLKERENGIQACGYIYVNKEIVPGLICHLITYFIVLAQFRLSEINEN